MKFASKRDWWISVLMLASSILFIGMIFDKEIMITIRGIFLIFGVLDLWIYNATFYVLSEDVLILRCGPLKVKVPYENINSIRYTKNLISSMALSADRLEIKVRGKGLGIIYISPINKYEFVEQLRRKCPELRILN